MASLFPREVARAGFAAADFWRRDVRESDGVGLRGIVKVPESMRQRHCRRHHQVTCDQTARGAICGSRNFCRAQTGQPPLMRAAGAQGAVLKIEY